MLVESEGWDESPSHNPTAVDAMSMDSGTYIKDVFEEVIPLFLPSLLVPPSPEFPVSPLVLPSPVSPLVPSSLDSPVTPLVPPSPMSSVNPPSLPLPPLVPYSPSASPMLSTEDLPRFLRPLALPSPEDPLAPLLASVPITPLRPVDLSPSPLLPLSAPLETIILTAPAGSLIPPALPWSDIILSLPLAPSDSVLPPAPSSPSVPPAPPQVLPRMLVTLHLSLQCQRCHVGSSQFLSVVLSVASLFT